jgi:hypothetical protein
MQSIYMTKLEADRISLQRAPIGPKISPNGRALCAHDFVWQEQVTCQREEGRIMRTKTGLLSIAGFLGLVVAAEAASPFDGTYQVSSSTKVNQTFLSRGGDMGYCPDRRPGPFTVVDGVARYSTQSGDNLVAPVAPNGQFEMRHVDSDGSSPLRVLGEINVDRRVYVRQMGNSCSYDFVWQKQPD